MDTFSNILKQFSGKHKAVILFMLLTFTTGSFLGGKYFDNVKNQKDIIELENSKTSIEKNCETQKQAILATQRELQTQLSSILTDLVSLKKEMLAGGMQIKQLDAKQKYITDAYTKQEINSFDVACVDSDSVVSYSRMVIPPAPPTKKATKPQSNTKNCVVVNKKATVLLDSLVSKTENLIKKR